MTAADKYYLKARDYYPYNYEEALEALEYGLSCDDEHAGLLTLKGRIYYTDLKRFDAAKECFELALYYDASFTDTYYAYLDFALTIEDYPLMARLVAKALKQTGIDKAAILYKEALMYEMSGSYDNAVKSLANAKMHCTSGKSLSFYEEEAERVKEKERDVRARQLPINIILK